MELQNNTRRGDVSSALYLASTILGLIELNTFSNSFVRKQQLLLRRLHSHILTTKWCHVLCPVDFPCTPLSYLLFSGGLESWDSHLGPDNFPGCTSALWACIRQQLYSHCILTSHIMNLFCSASHYLLHIRQALSLSSRDRRSWTQHLPTPLLVPDHLGNMPSALTVHNETLMTL